MNKSNACDDTHVFVMLSCSQIPFSAVDVSVGQHMFSKCVNGLLKKKTR